MPDAIYSTIDNTVIDSTVNVTEIFSDIITGGVTFNVTGTGGILSLNALTTAHQTFGATSDSNVTLSITSDSSNHQFALGWTGLLPLSRGGTNASTANAAINNLLPSQTGNAGMVLTTNGTDTSWTSTAAGSVTSVAMTVPSILSVTGSPITSSGVLALSLANQTGNTVFASPSTGASGTPTFRSLVSDDLPTVPITKGGTGQTTANAALNALLPSQALNAGKYLQTDGTNTSWATSGTVTSVAATGANGIGVTSSPITSSGILAFSLGAITPTSVAASGTVTGSNLTGTNTGDQTITLTGDVTGSGTGSFATTIGNAAVTYVKIQNVTNNRLLGRSTAGSGTVEEISLGSGLSLSGGVLTATGTGGTVTSVNASATDGLAVSGVPFTTTGTIAISVTANGLHLDRLATIASNTILGNNTGVTGSVTALTTAQVKTLLNLAGTNSGDVTLAGETYLTIAGQVITAGAVNLSGTNVTGTLAAARFPALTGDVTTTAGSLATTIGAGKVTNSMLAGSIAASKLVGTDIATVGTITSGTWTGTTVGIAYGGSGQTTANAALNAFLPSQVGNAGKVLQTDGTNTSWQAVAGTGTVTYVGMTVPAELSVTPASITTTGTFAVTWATETANYVFAGPTTGTAATPTFRALVSADIPSLAASKITSGTLAVSIGGTGQTTYTDGQLLIGNTTGSTLTKATLTGTANRLSVTNGSGSITLDIDAAYVGQATITTLGTVTTGTWNGSRVAEIYGGTGNNAYAVGDILYASAINTLSVLTAGTDGYVLTLAGGVPTWAAAGSGTVTSVAVSGGATGLTTTGGPITTSGTITISGTLVETNGGTGNSAYAVGDILYASAINTLSALTAGTDGYVLTLAGGVPTWAAGGTVTSVGVSGGTTGLTTTGGPITTSGTITIAGTLAETNGGTNQTTYTLGDTLYSSAANTLSKLAGNITATKKFLVQTGTGAVSAAPTWDTIAAGDVPTLNQNTTGTAANVTGTVAIGNGGTGQTTANAAFNALAPSQTSNSGKFLTTNGTDTSWATVSAAPGGSTTQVQYNSTGSFAGAAGFTFDGTSAITLGVAGASTGSIAISGSTSGTVTLNVGATAGTWTFTLPADGGTSGYFLQTNGSGVATWASVSGGLSYWTESESTASPNNVIYANQFLATGTATNIDAIFSPKGTGSFLAQVPDSTATGGNKRGTHCIDLQTQRSAASQVASGQNSVIIGGYYNTVSGQQASIVGGHQNTCAANDSAIVGGSSNSLSGGPSFIGAGSGNTISSSGAYCFIGAGQSCQINTNSTGINGIVTGYQCKIGTSSAVTRYNFIGGGYQNVINNTCDYGVIVGGVSNSIAAGYDSCFIGGGSTNTISNHFSTIAGGDQNTISGEFAAIPGGYQASAPNLGQFAFASGRFAATGDAQLSMYVLRNQTTDATATKLYTDGSTTQITLLATQAITFSILLVGKTTGAAGPTVGGWVIEGTIYDNGGTATLAAAITTTVLNAPAGWGAPAVGGTGLNMEISVTGVAATTIDWVATVRTSEVLF